MEIPNPTRLDLDRGILEFDRALRTLSGEPVARRPSPAGTVPEDSLDDDLRRRAAALMRVNHCGEVCAQALYRGQALGSSNEDIKSALAKAAGEEADHLAWSAQRVRELGGRLSLLNPLWYAGSLVIGYAAGRLSERWNLGARGARSASACQTRHARGRALDDDAVALDLAPQAQSGRIS